MEVEIYHNDELLNITGQYHIITGDITGILLKQRGKDDLHISFQILTGDDGTWFVSENDGVSSHWFDEYIEVLERAVEWCKKNAVRESHGYGFKFKEAN